MESRPAGERPDAIHHYREGLPTKTKALLAGAGVVALVLAWLFATRILPRWWAHRAGDVADGRTSVGGFAGLLIGFLFTVVPLFVARMAFRRERSWRRRAVVIAIALVLAAPNLTTLGIVLGDGSGAHAGERTLDVEAPGFRGGTLVGAVLGGAAFAALAYRLVRPRRKRTPAAAARSGDDQ